VRPEQTIGPPPQPHRTKFAARGATIAFALIGPDAAAAKGNRYSEGTGE
jgi:hypothetical protein